jgi:hypothetical protein
MAKEQKKAQEGTEQTGGEEQRKLLKDAPAVPGLDWQAIFAKYGPVFTKTLLFLFQQFQGLEGGMHAKKSVSCGPDQCGSLDEAIEFQAKALVLLVQHRDCCEPCEPTGE